ncbi:unnamed protein product [Effrenium voratum]|uniref:MFS transporter n=1 Tax=Effrenium voratum TaxID=2562239 RepID=A0AA36IGC1_9DINO|nr:unnamed protein product [Effrenium voratum]CAJ1387082.1 unnamed protein product [Effrenium voratum]|mmetsp:Transcript_129175/g.306544  ORF Transcript_129175/g.306544 Transcript_129175/m.306544 type:complete len:517 (+) Transcript_129175:51-1601(+)|eukprot:CAMPEP_0181439610 /NCGR_PEP_ID=MMETSP1110-20121109/22520_1 /TAXON_ID=174948 /ORGANISM="Symbiodinium sp., Strain CCMP421" /LENGTH=516 /DNA_ID=CAMNT_0023563347 /DNA_START=45 /DNA_END=1595 /DNA_ORIENTATION=+
MSARAVLLTALPAAQAFVQDAETIFLQVEVKVATALAELPAEMIAPGFRAQAVRSLLSLATLCAVLWCVEMLGLSCSIRRSGQWVYVGSCLLVAMGQSMLLTVSLPLATVLTYSAAASGFLASTTSLGGLLAQLLAASSWSTLGCQPYWLLRSSMVATTFLHLFFHGLFVGALCLPLSATSLWWCLVVSRTLAGFFAALSCLSASFLAFAVTPQGELLNLQTSVQGAYGAGQCLGNMLASSAIVFFQISGESPGQVLAEGAAPVLMFTFAIALLLATSVLFVPRAQLADQVPPVVDGATESISNTKQHSELGSLEVCERKGIFRNAVIYNFERTFSVASIEVATTMISQVEFGFSTVMTGWIFGLIAIGSLLANVIVAFTPSNTDLRICMMVCFAAVGVVTTPFLLDWWPWWTLYVADALMMTMTNAANGISDGVALLAATGVQELSRESFINQKMLSMAAAKVIAAPLARGLLPWLGRNGYGALQTIVSLAGFLGIWKMYCMAGSREQQENSQKE